MRVRAPGKVVLLGEYAVLDGAPALVAAVDSGVQCTVTAQTELEVCTPGDSRFVRAALLAINAPAARYQFKDWNPLHLATKPGLGGSAAATVAACMAGLYARDADCDAVQAIATEVHRRVQGSGSGIDIAASFLGGVQRFQDGRASRVAKVKPVVIWSGQSAATGPRVKRYRAWATKERAIFCGRSGELLDQWQDDPVSALRAGHRLLSHMAKAAGIDWTTPAHDWLTDTAVDCGGACKPSGAGGGDIAVALFPDSSAEAAFLRRVSKRGLTHLPLSLAGPASVTGYPHT